MPLDNGPVDYRQLQAPVQPLSPDQLPSTGRAQEAEALAGLFKSFSGATNALGVQYGQVKGQQAGAAAGASGVPSLKEGIAQFTAFGQAYNNAATGAFLTESEIHAEDTASKLRIQANNDPAAFAKMYGAAADAAVKESPTQIQGAMRDMYNKHLASGVSALSGAQALEIQQTQKNIYDQGTERAVTRVAILQGSPNAADQAAAVDEHLKLEARIQGGVQAGLYSPAEAEAKSINAMREITSQVFTTNVDRAIADMSNGKGDQGVIDLLENFRKMHEQNLADTNQSPVLSEAEYNNLMQQAKQKLQQENIIEAYTRRDGKTAEQVKFEAGDVKITTMMAQHAPGDVLASNIAQMVQSGDLKPEVGRAVLASIQRGQDAPPDKKALYYALNDPNRFSWSAQDIATKPGLNWAQRQELTAKIATEKNGWESHDQIKDARAVITAGLKLPSGIALETASDEEKKAATDAQVELTRQLTALPPDKRDTEAPRIANNVVLEMKARDALAEAAARQNSIASVQKNYGPGGVNYRSDADLKARIELRQQQIKDAKARADQYRSEIKN